MFRIPKSVQKISTATPEGSISRIPSPPLPVSSPSPYINKQAAPGEIPEAPARPPR
ncbi:MAG TPA: hypothetical protein VGV91_15955 [Rubrobacter sp.]|nr:hypothetical protein [Rubrobacter sp.]